MIIDYKNIIEKIEKSHVLRRLFIKGNREKSFIYAGQLPIMIYIYEHDNCTQVDIAEKLKVTPASVAASTKRLQKAGFITKRVDENNLRCKHLSLTDKGRELLYESYSMYQEYDKLIFKGITDDEIKSAEIFLDKLIYNMEEVIGEQHGKSDFYDLNRLIMKLQNEKEDA